MLTRLLRVIPHILCTSVSAKIRTVNGTNSRLTILPSCTVECNRPSRFSIDPMITSVLLVTRDTNTKFNIIT